MFTYSQITRWLTFSLDPITVEDWLGNREIFGHSQKPDEREKELEEAYQMAQLLGRTTKGSLLDEKDFLLVAPLGKDGGGEAWVYGEKVEKIGLSMGEIKVVTTDKNRTIKLKLHFHGNVRIDGKNRLEWTGSGKERIIFDLS